jgi:hypothetical protein
MPMIYIRKELYDTLIKGGRDPSTFINELVEKSLSPKKDTKEPKHEKN